MRRGVVTISILALLLTTCTLSRVDQTGTVTVRGTLLAPDGSPLAQNEVILFKEADLVDAVLGFSLIAGSLGTICLADEPPTLCDRARRTTTGADGTFSFALRGGDTQGVAGTAATLHLAADVPATEGEVRGPSVTARFKVQTTDLHLPTLRLWRPDVELGMGRDQLHVEWDPFDGGSDGARVMFFSGPASAIVWAVDGRSPVAIDARVLEDSAGTAAVESSSTDKRDGTTFRITRWSGQRRYAGSAGAPLSRHSPCSGAGSTEGTETAPLSPCPVTDGNLAPAQPSAATRPMTTITVDLGRSRPVDLVVVRGCPAGCQIETSDDGRTWIAAGVDDRRPFVAADAPRGTTARAVRVRSPADLGGLGEVSAW